MELISVRTKLVNLQFLGRLELQNTVGNIVYYKLGYPIADTTNALKIDLVKVVKLHWTT